MGRQNHWAKRREWEDRLPRQESYGLTVAEFCEWEGVLLAHGYSMLIGTPLDIGIEVLFAVRRCVLYCSACGSANGHSGSAPNVTIGVPVYMRIARIITTSYPVLVS